MDPTWTSGVGKEERGEESFGLDSGGQRGWTAQHFGEGAQGTTVECSVSGRHGREVAMRLKWKAKWICLPIQRTTLQLE